MPASPTRKQSAASARNAEAARAARRVKEAERQAAAAAELEAAYQPVRAELDGCLEALVNRRMDLASRRIQAALVLLARVAASSPAFDPARSRGLLLALRAAKEELTKGMPGLMTRGPR